MQISATSPMIAEEMTSKEASTPKARRDVMEIDFAK
jgi:hypothetical protein